MRRRLGVLVAMAMLVAVIPAGAEGASGQRAEVRFTPYGVAHVSAASFEGAGYGYGWALARDNLCAVTERAVTLAGQRSRNMDAGARYNDPFAGGEISNLDSDAVYLYLFPPAAIRVLKRAASPDMRALARGFAAGFNRHVASQPLPGEACRDAAWFRPLEEDDVWRRIAHVPLLETTAGLLREIVAAAPPQARQAFEPPADTATRLASLETVRGASNAAAFGREGVEGGAGGLSFANPHYAWHGTERLHAFHLTVHGKLDVFGATAYGLPFPMMGFSNAVGWGITHTTDKRSTLYELTLDPADATRYLVGGRRERMRRTVVEVMTRDGLVPRGFWETRYGPVVEGEKIPWDRERAYAFADPERGNVRFADQFLAIARARSVREIQQAQGRFLGSPWSNVTAADRSGDVYYSNISVAADISDQQLARCVITSPARMFMDVADVTTLNGSDPACAWTRSNTSGQRGVIPVARRPWMVRSDVVFNSNDSHWFATDASDGRLEGYARVIGPERSTRGERTRIAALYARDIMGGSELTGAPGATPQKWERLFFSARNLTAELILDDLLADCSTRPDVAMEDGAVVSLAHACDVLRRWDRRDTLQSRGSALFAEFLRGLEAVPMTGFALAPGYWRVPFDAADPVGTPRGFKPTDETRRLLARSLMRFQSAGVAIDAPLGDVQSVTRNGRRLPVSGSTYTYHMVRPGAFAQGQGITEVRSGDSYIHVVSLKDDGVRGRFIVTYAQSTNPASPHFADMTEVFSGGGLLDVAFTEQEVRAAQVGETVRLDPDAGH